MVIRKKTCFIYTSQTFFKMTPQIFIYDKDVKFILYRLQQYTELNLSVRSMNSR